MVQELTEEEIKKLFTKAQSGILFKMRWHYHSSLYMYYMHRITVQQFICKITNQSPTTWIKLMVKAFPHMARMIYMDFNIQNPKELINELSEDLLRSLDMAVENGKSLE